MKFIISPEIYAKCTEFSTNSVSSSSDKYARRNQFNVEKIKYDIKVGKIGEQLVYDSLCSNFPNLSEPDYNVYDKKNKSWDADLKDLHTPFTLAVKSQDIRSELEFGRSWVFQHRVGKKFDNDVAIFDNSDNTHYVSFVSLNVPKRIGEIIAIVKVNWLHEHNMFKPMQLLKLQDNKVAVYYEDLENYKEELWQL